jgi:hypothetical protein|tara:strand:+ start:580 stop:837 length:258 start_codon:yes stop_codon:yes gene_type:complete
VGKPRRHAKGEGVTLNSFEPPDKAKTLNKYHYLAKPPDSKYTAIEGSLHLAEIKHRMTQSVDGQKKRQLARYYRHGGKILIYNPI